MKFLFSNLRLLARKFKSVVFINIVGLAVAFAVMLVVVMQARYDLSYDCGFQNSGKIFRVEVEWQGSGWGFMDNINYQLPEIWKERIPEIKDYCLKLSWAQGELLTEDGGAEGASYNIAVMPVTSGFMEVFTPEIVAGDASGTFGEGGQGHAIISEKTAAALFGKRDPIGQVLVNSTQPERRFIIDAVFRDFPDNSSIAGDLFTLTPREEHFGNYNYFGYFLIDPADCDAVLAKINDPALYAEDFEDEFGEQFALTELSDFYLHGGKAASRVGHIDFTLYLLVIGIVILVVAIINFINLSMAMAPSRVRNVNIHRILGIGKGSLRTSLSMEAVVMALVAVAAGCLAVHWFSTSLFKDFFSADLTLGQNIPLVAGCALGLLAVAFLVGMSSSRYATSFDVAIALKSSFALTKHGAGLRNVLVVVQFTAAIFFICFAVFVGLQYRYMSNYSVGYEKENIVSIPLPADSLSIVSLGQELMKNPAVIDYTVSSTPGYLWTSWGSTVEGKEVHNGVWPTDHNTLSFFGIDIIAGENFSAGAGHPEVIVNREFLRKYDFAPEELIGKEYREFTIVGVAEDVNFNSLHEPITPMVFVIDPWYWWSAFVKISGEDVPATLDYIEKTWHKFPSERQYSVSFLDEDLDALYKRELNTSKLIGILGLMAVTIAVMGVFGLIMFNTRYKAREIAIRKVNGATIGGVALMLNRGMLILVGVALVLAVPLTLVFISRWVEEFAYKASVPWWLLPAGGVLVLLIAVATVSWQSYRAASANPVKTLMSE